MSAGHDARGQIMNGTRGSGRRCKRHHHRSLAKDGGCIVRRAATDTRCSAGSAKDDHNQLIIDISACSLKVVPRDRPVSRCGLPGIVRRSWRGRDPAGRQQLAGKSAMYRSVAVKALVTSGYSPGQATSFISSGRAVAGTQIAAYQPDDLVDRRCSGRGSVGAHARSRDNARTGSRHSPARAPASCAGLADRSATAMSIRAMGTRFRTTSPQYHFGVLGGIRSSPRSSPPMTSSPVSIKRRASRAKSSLALNSRFPMLQATRNS
jgi:hypothetical protein